MATTTRYRDAILALPTKVFVDIGASNDPNESQTEWLLAHGWSGIMFECNPDKYQPLMRRMKGKPVVVLSQKVVPETIADVLRSHNVPQDFFLSLDIDGYDIFVLKAILDAYRPQFIVSEINEKIPPPMKFSVLYRRDYWWGGWHFFGYSISMLEDLLPQYGYKVDSLDYNNVILVPGTQETPIETLYRDGYFQRPDGWTRFYYNQDFDPMYPLPYDKQIDFVRAKFKEFDGQYTLDGRVYVANTGEIRLTHPFGEWITKYSADTRFQRYVEVGTSTGRGSTCCFYEGFVTRTDTPVLQSYETNPDRYKEAESLWYHAPSIRSIYGRVLPNRLCPIFSEVRARVSTVNEAWYTEDIQKLWVSPERVPTDPEVVLLDGSEYLTWYEFDRIFKTLPSVRVFLLNATNTQKNPAVLAALAADPAWECVARSDDGVGWAIFERRPEEVQMAEMD